MPELPDLQVFSKNLDEGNLAGVVGYSRLTENYNTNATNHFHDCLFAYAKV
jgi:hypothetical protein